MKRRQFLIATTTTTLATALFARTAMAAPIEYTPGMVNARLSAGETLFLDFKASWCTTCAAQGRVMDALRAANPAYEQGITFITVDWDTYQDDPLTTSLAIPRRSTLVVLKGDQELGRIVAGTSEAEIKALMDTALNAATS